jgi:hypothetical protein
VTHAELMSDVVGVLSDPRQPEPMRRVLAAAMLITEASKAEAEPALREAVCCELERLGRQTATLRMLTDRSPRRRRPLWNEGVELFVFLQDVRAKIAARRMANPFTLIEGGAS